MVKKTANDMTVTQELKSVAKAVGSSLRRHGHEVPHSVVLHALASALNRRDWHKLRAAVSRAEQQPASAASFDERTLFWLRLAEYAGRPVETSPSTQEQALAQAQHNAGPTAPGVLHWGGWHLPATLRYADATVDAGDFRPETAAAGRLTLRYPSGSVEVEVGYDHERGWFVTSQGVEEFAAQLRKAIARPLPLPLMAPSQAAARAWAPAHQERIAARFWTDDRTFEVVFDARPWLEQADERALSAVVNTGFASDACVDDVALWTEQQGLSVDLSEAMAYVSAVQRSRSGRNFGFECALDARDVLCWLAHYRPGLLARLLCEQQGVRIERDDQGWQWHYAQERSTEPLDSAEAACLDAYLRFELLQQALQDIPDAPVQAR